MSSAKAKTIATREAKNRRTRIVATIGPASDSPEVLRKMADAGMDVARIPLAHGSIEDAIARVKRVRETAPEVGILADLPGPKIRASEFPKGGVVLATGSEVVLGSSEEIKESSANAIGVSNPDIVAGLEEDDLVAIGDGGVSLRVISVTGKGIKAVVRAGGKVQGRPGVTVPTSRVQLVTPTKEDLERLHALVEVGVEMVAISFVRSAADVESVRRAAGPEAPLLCAKIETPQGVLEIDRILETADMVMVARGDMGVRLPLEDVPHIQKQIIRSGVRYGRPVITATQMLESMITSLVPTRAEVTDVANAVLDGSSAVMLSAETAVGVDPVNVIATMSKIVERSEENFDYITWGNELGAQQISGPSSAPERITAAITSAAWRAAVEQDAKAIIACTSSGATARAISRFRPPMPILATTPYQRTAHQLTVSWGVDSLVVQKVKSTDDVVWFAVQAAVDNGYARSGDVVVVLAGSPDEANPIADTLRIVRIA
ncbi:MAG: pyruvate kinase [Firmicutes bacterium]|nr:pyruvate kinase [Bacillota bacterium]